MPVLPKGRVGTVQFFSVADARALAGAAAAPAPARPIILKKSLRDHRLFSKGIITFSSNIFLSFSGFDSAEFVAGRFPAWHSPHFCKSMA
jgi:hypothetical protein